MYWTLLTYHTYGIWEQRYGSTHYSVKVIKFATYCTPNQWKVNNTHTYAKMNSQSAEKEISTERRLHISFFAYFILCIFLLGIWTHLQTAASWIQYTISWKVLTSLLSVVWLSLHKWNPQMFLQSPTASGTCKVMDINKLLVWELCFVFPHILRSLLTDSF